VTPSGDLLNFLEELYCQAASAYSLRPSALSFAMLHTATVETLGGGVRFDC